MTILLPPRKLPRYKPQNIPPTANCVEMVKARLHMTMHIIQRLMFLKIWFPFCCCRTVWGMALRAEATCVTTMGQAQWAHFCLPR